MKIMKSMIIGLVFLMTGCVLPMPGDFYIVMEGGYQDVKTSERIDGGGEAVFKRNDYTYGGALGYGLSLVKLYFGAELGFTYTSFKDDLGVEGNLSIDRNRIPMARVDENWILNAVGDAGFYPTSDLLLFGRAGYIYVDRDVNITASGPDSIMINVPDELSAVAFGGGLEYQIGLGLGVRATYLRHDGDRDAHDIRVGVVWRL